MTESRKVKNHHAFFEIPWKRNNIMGKNAVRSSNRPHQRCIIARGAIHSNYTTGYPKNMFAILMATVEEP